MSTIDLQSVGEIHRSLGERIKRLRLRRNFDQRLVAERAGISVRALRNLEAGNGSSVETLIRTLKALGALDGIEQLVPEISVNPLSLLTSARPQQRVRRPRNKPEKGAQ